MDEDLDIASLPRPLLESIDRAFDYAIQRDQSQDFSHSKKRPRLEGGFLGQGSLDSTAGYQAGGFVVEESEQPEDTLIDNDLASEHGNGSKNSHIPLHLIPSALQLLDLPSDDEQVLSVFRNAASGWSGGESGEQGVSRKDWRAVCAVLMDSGDGEDQQPSDRDGDTTEKSRATRAMRTRQKGKQRAVDNSTFEDYPDYDSDDEDEDAYVDDQGDNETEDSDDMEYNEPSQAATPTRRATRRNPSPHMQIIGDITPRQRSECRKAFALFFPDLEPNSKELLGKRIMIKDISRVATLLKEKLTAEEIMEMLEAFSSSPDKSMSLGDFEQMMIAAKLA